MKRVTAMAAMIAGVLVSTVSPAWAATILIRQAPTADATTTTTFTATGAKFVGNGGALSLDGFTVTGGPSYVYGNRYYGFGDRGVWSNFSYIANSSIAGSVTFDLGRDVGSVGAFLNHANNSGAPIISAFDSQMNALGSYDLSQVGRLRPGYMVNGGAFRGIRSDATNIRYFRLTGGVLAAHSVTTSPVSAVPEPATWALMIGGFGMAGGALRHRRARAGGAPAIA